MGLARIPRASHARLTMRGHMRRIFDVSADADSPTHTLTVEAVDFDKATPAQRQAMYAEGLRSVTIKAQGTLRRKMAKNNGPRTTAQLQAVAQQVWDATFSGIRADVPTATVVDAKALKLTPEQIAGLEASGAVVINK